MTNERWLDFPGQRTFWLNWRHAVEGIGVKLSTLSVDEIQAYVSTDEDMPTNGFTPASGQLAEMNYLSNQEVHIFNATCTEYFLRVEMRGHLSVDPTLPRVAVKAGEPVEMDAGATDAPAESGLDASSTADAPDAPADSPADVSDDAG
jgi:hypothetical protein